MLVLLLALKPLLLEPEQSLADSSTRSRLAPPLIPKLFTPQQTGPGKKILLIQ